MTISWDRSKNQPYRPKPLPGKSFRTLLEPVNDFCSIVTIPGELGKFQQYHTANKLFVQDPNTMSVVTVGLGEIFVLPLIHDLERLAAQHTDVHSLSGSTDKEQRNLLLGAFGSHAISLAVTSSMLDMILVGSRSIHSAKKIHWLTLGSVGPRVSSVIGMHKIPTVFYAHEIHSAFESACVKRGLLSIGAYAKPELKAG